MQDHLFDLFLVHFHSIITLRSNEGPGNYVIIDDLHPTFMVLWRKIRTGILDWLLADHLDALGQPLLEGSLFRRVDQFG